MITKMAIEFKIRHGIILALSLTIVLLICCISLVSYQMHQLIVNQGNDGPKQALKSSVQDSSTTLPEKVTDSTSTFNTTEDITKDNTTETPFQEDSSTTLPQNMTDSTTFFNTTKDVTKETPFQEDSTTLLEKVTDYFTTFSTLLKTSLRLLGV